MLFNMKQQLLIWFGLKMPFNLKRWNLLIRFKETCLGRFCQWSSLHCWILPVETRSSKTLKCELTMPLLYPQGHPTCNHSPRGLSSQNTDTRSTWIFPPCRPQHSAVLYVLWWSLWASWWLVGSSPAVFQPQWRVWTPWASHSSNLALKCTLRHKKSPTPLSEWTVVKFMSKYSWWWVRKMLLKAWEEQPL